MDKNMFFDSLSDEELLNQIAQQKPMTPEELSLLSEKQNEIPLVGVPVDNVPEQVISEQAPVIAPATTPVTKRTINRTQENTNKQNAQNNKTEDDTVPDSPKPGLTRQEALLEEYMKLSGKEATDELKAARERDRMLKVGGALGDALATIINAEGQRRAAIPGVQVQQGAGLGEITKMFETAPEVAGDLAARKEALLKQYAELAKGERSKAAISSREKIAENRDKALKEAAMIKASGKGGLTPYQELMQEEKQMQRQEKDLKALKEVEIRKRTIEDNVERAKAIISRTGTFEAFGPESEELNGIMDEISVDMAKLQDPDSVARPSEVALVRKNLIPEGAIGKLGIRNKTATEILDNFKERINDRAKIGYQVRGIKAPMEGEAVKGTQKQDYEPKIDKVLKANPGASRQQVIEALKKDKKLPEDYK
jgi:hypothetical protein